MSPRVVLSGRVRTLLLAVASTAAFALAARVLDPALVRPGAWPRPLAEPELGAVLATLAGYQAIYQDFFASGGNPAMLGQFPASAGVKHRIFRDVGFLRDEGLVMVQDLASATTLSAVQAGPDTAEVVLFEEWNWIFQREADRSPASNEKGLGQGFRYVLTREGGRWIVTSWRQEDVPPPAAPLGAFE